MASWGPGLGLPCHYFGHINWRHTIGVYFVLTSSPLVVGLTKTVIFNMWPPRLHAQHMREDRGTRARPGDNTACSAHVALAESQLWAAERGGAGLMDSCQSQPHPLSSLHGFLFLSLHFNFLCTDLDPSPRPQVSWMNIEWFWCYYYCYYFY